jgi:hypothetical protein
MLTKTSYLNGHNMHSLLCLGNLQVSEVVNQIIYKFDCNLLHKEGN